MQKIKITLLILTAFLTSLSAQDQRFMGGIIVGLNASQIDGDDAAGFSKAGLLVGLRGGAYLSEKTSLTIDMLYSQRGSKHTPKNPDFFDSYTISTPYIELPLLFHYKDWLVMYDDGSQYYKVSAEAGPVVSYLLDPKLTNSTYESEIPNFNKIDIAWTIGVSYYFGQHFGVSARYLKSITPLYNSKKHRPNFHSLYGYNFNFGVFYLL